MTVRTVGVEEELMLVDPDTGQLTAVSERAVRAHQGASVGVVPDGALDDSAEVEQELYLQQIETSTPPCSDASALADGLRRGRKAVGTAAARAGAQAVAMPTPVLIDATERITPKPRYRRIYGEYGELARESLVCAMHVHVGVSDDEEGVRVLDRIRPWLPVLLALSANSPFWCGRDTGHASWRSQVWNRWPSAGPQQPFGDVAGYREVSARMMQWGASIDPGMLYFDVRLAERYPTVEIRVADVCTEVDDAVLVAVLARALVDTCAAQPDTPTAWRTDLLRSAAWRAARYGMAGPLVHPGHGGLAAVREVFEAVLGFAGEALEAAGDRELVRAAFERTLARGNGAARQRAVHESTGDLAAVVADLARRTEASWA